LKNEKEVTILLDMDGTVIDSTEAILESFHFAFSEQEFEFDKPDESITELVGYPLDYMFEALGVAKNRVADFVQSYKKHYHKVSKEKTVLIPKAVEAIELANSFANIAAVTTKTTQYTIELLEAFGLDHYFQTVIGRQDVQNPKPHPEPIFKACKFLNISPNKTIYMVGDTKLDIIAANKAKISSIAVLCGYGKEEELSCYTPNVTPNTLEAVKLIKSFHSKA
jgi:phosphoglycolate phosphatase